MPALDLLQIPYLGARWFTEVPAAKPRNIRVIVLHSMEAPEKGSTAEACARYFATTDRKASAHYCVDNNSIVQSLQTRDIAYGAPGCNATGIHIELAGYAKQVREQWLDGYGIAMLDLAAQLTFGLSRKFLIPITLLTAHDLQNLQLAKWPKHLGGITTHAQVSRAFGKTDHTDPGGGFPMDHFLTRCLAAARAAETTPPRKATG